MRIKNNALLATVFLMSLLFASSSSIFGQTVPDDSDDASDENVARVARISFIDGEAQIRRADTEDWEKVTKNLPIVEGDEIATKKDTRIEIQFDTYKYLRLAENAYLKVTTLREEGIAVSLPEGSLTLRALEFNKKREFFEIDAPQTTVALQKAGMYRIDAGDENYTVVQINVTEGGKAQVYSLNAGFALNDGRRARVFTEGEFAGEWDLGDATRNSDQFDSWSLERDDVIAERLRKSYYEKYYDRDIYGAEDLTENGDWIYTRDYGYVWKPYDRAINDYDNWSPYRYGQWRWVPAFGWTWVNYEPWGWATYHHGRWMFFDGDWVWSPYPQNRRKRSWWRPALVIIASIGRDIYWCPLPYDYDYFSYYNRRRGHGRHDDNGGSVNPTPTPTPIPPVSGGTIIRPNDGTGRVFGIGETKGVITVSGSEFGRGNGMFRTANQNVARQVLSKTQDEVKTPPVLPTYKDLNGEINEKIIVKNPTYANTKPDVNTGASTRKPGMSLDDDLRRKRVFGDRTPVNNSKANRGTSDNSDKRGTGAVNRTPDIIDNQKDDNKKADDKPSTNRQRKSIDDNQSPPIRREEPKYEPPPRREAPKYEPPPQRDEPKYEPPPQREQPKYEPPPPQKEEPKNEPPPPSKSDEAPAPSKNGKPFR